MPPDSRAADLARYYDLDLQDDPGDLDLYRALAAAADGPILELAAGSGRVCVELAAAGHEVTGVDSDAAMLDRARAAWKERSESVAVGGGSLTLIEHDLTTLRLDGRFELVILALNSLLLLGGRGTQRAALEAIARHLAPSGRAVVDVWLPTPDDLSLYDGRIVLDWVRDDPTTGDQVAKLSSARYQSATATASVTTFFDARDSDGRLRRVSRTDEITFVTASELAEMAARAGLQLETVAGDYELSELAGEGDRIVLVGRSATR